MYDLPDFFLVENAIDRYSIGDRTPGLRHARRRLADDHHAARRAPRTRPARANWLPTPAGAFRPLLRLYEPDTAVFDGRYELPPITRVGDSAT